MSDDSDGIGKGNGRHDDEKRAAIEATRATFEDLRDGIDAVAALVDIVEEIGEAVIAAAHDDADGDGQFDAGAEVLETRGDDSDGLRAGLRWLIEACSAGIPDMPPPTRTRSSRKKKARSRG